MMATRTERNEQISITVSLEEKRRFLAMAARHDMSLADYCRRVLNGFIPATKMTNKEVDTYDGEL